MTDAMRCAAGNTPTRCCVGNPWAGITGMDAMMYGEPLDPVIITAAATAGVDPHQLAEHVGVVHGWEPHDQGYEAHVTGSVECLRGGGCGTVGEEAP